MKSALPTCFILLALAVLPLHAQVIADLAADYHAGTLNTVITPLADSHGTGTWTYAVTSVNTDSTPTSYSGAQPLTFEANTNGGSGATLYGTNGNYPNDIIELPAVSNGKIFPDSPNLPADFLSVHPDAGTNAALVRWTAGVDEIGTLSLSFDLSRMNVGTNGISGDQGHDDFTVYRGTTLIYSNYDNYPGDDTGLQTITLNNVTPGTTLNFVTSSTAGVLGYNLAFLKVDISEVPEPSTWALFGLGAGALLISLRRRASHA